MDLASIFSFLRQIFWIILILVIFLTLYMYLNQENMIFPTSINGMKYPEDNPYPYKSPIQLGLNYKEVKTKTSDNIKLVGWLVYKEENIKKRTLLYFHENAGSKILFTFIQIIIYSYRCRIQITFY